jgi:hypothetical protein
MTDLPDDEFEGPDDCFAPPEESIEVSCLHCGQVYQSDMIRWADEVIDGRKMGFWRCPTPDCDGAGFGFDIFPTDPSWEDPTGRLHVMADDSEDTGAFEEDEFNGDAGSRFDPRNN